LIIRIAAGWDFRAWYRECFEKNWPGVQAHGTENRNLKMEIGARIFKFERVGRRVLEFLREKGNDSSGEIPDWRAGPPGR
jgi:hypothetical protein